MQEGRRKRVALRQKLRVQKGEGGINVRVTPPLTKGGERVLCAWHLNIVVDVGGFREGLLSIAIADRTVPFVFTPLLLALQAILTRSIFRNKERERIQEFWKIYDYTAV